MTAMPADRVAAQRRPRRPRPVRGYAPGKEDCLRRLRKIEGQVRGPQKMTEAGARCPDVVTQAAAAASSPDDADAQLAEVTTVLRQVIRL
jgi:DNA-binding FrmR family transcriptional regulator